MNELASKISYFKEKQAEIMKVHAEVMPARQAIIDEFEKEKTKLEELYTKKVNELCLDLETKKAQYKGELKEFIGITDGEKTNVIDLLEALMRVRDMS